MSCGLPVLSTKSGGPESIITSNDYGFLCDENELADMLEKIAVKEFDSVEIRNYVKILFLRILLEKLELIYSEIRE